MLTSQANVYTPGTFEHEIASLLSEEMGQNQGPMTQLLRRILFGTPKDSEHVIDWNHVADQMKIFFPEHSAKINAIKIKYDSKENIMVNPDILEIMKLEETHNKLNAVLKDFQVIDILDYVIARANSGSITHKGANAEVAMNYVSLAIKHIEMGPEF